MNSKNAAAIAKLRRRIDALDSQLVTLLNRRAGLSLAIGRMKRAAGLRLFNHAREREIARRVTRANAGPLSDSAVQRLWREVLRQTRGAVRLALHREEGKRAAAAPRSKR